jgi:hypothetical protein
MNQKAEDVELMTISEAPEAAGGLERQLMEMAAKHSENNQETGHLDRNTCKIHPSRVQKSSGFLWDTSKKGMHC